MPRRRHHKAENLSARAQEIIEDGLVGDKSSYDEISLQIFEQTGEKISPSAIQRYHTAKVRPRVAATVQAREMAKEVAQLMAGATDADVRRALEMKTASLVYPMLEELVKDKPEMAGFFLNGMAGRRLAEQRLEQRERELALRTKQHELARSLAETKLEEIKKRIEGADKKGTRPRTPEELQQMLLDVYGIAHRPAPEAAPAAAKGGANS